MLFAATSGSVLGSSERAVKTPQEEMELMPLKKGSCAIQGAQSVLIQHLQAWAPPPGSAGRVGGCSQHTEEGCPFVRLSGGSVPADSGGRLKLSRWDDRWGPSSKQSVLLPTDQQGVVSMLLGLRKPLQNGRRKVLLDLYLPRTVPCACRFHIPSCTAAWDASPCLSGRPAGKNLRLGVTGQPLWKT